MRPHERSPSARAALRTTTPLLAAWLVAACLVPTVLADLLDRVRVGGAPLGFLFSQEGAVVAFVLLLAAWVAGMNRSDAGRGR